MLPPPPHTHTRQQVQQWTGEICLRAEGGNDSSTSGGGGGGLASLCECVHKTKAAMKTEQKKADIKANMLKFSVGRKNSGTT